MTAPAASLVRFAATALIALALMAPTIVGALSAPASPEAEQGGCPEDGQQTEDFTPAIETVAACIELMPEQSTPEDESWAPSAQEARGTAIARPWGEEAA